MTELPLRAALRGETPYGAPTDAVPVRLNVNENPYAPPAHVVAAMAAATAAALTTANRYPDREATALRAALAGFAGVTAAQVWPANGSNEVMHQILGAFGGPGRTVVSFAPTYSMYPVYARDTDTAYLALPRRADHSIDVAAAAAELTALRPTVTMLASPNNPTGGLLPAADVQALHDVIAPFGVLVIDEAYIEFAGPGDSAVALLPHCPRLIVTRTLSKAFGLAGLRLGYAVTSEAIVAALRVVRLPYHLSALTLAAAEVAVRHAGDLLAPVSQVHAERAALASWLGERGFAVAPSAGNFLLVGPLPDAAGTFRRLLARGVLVRETGVAGCLRVSIGTPDENAAFRAALIEATAATARPGRMTQ